MTPPRETVGEMVAYLLVILILLVYLGWINWLVLR